MDFVPAWRRRAKSAALLLANMESGDSDQSHDFKLKSVEERLLAAEKDRVPGSGVARGGSPRSPTLAGLVSWRLSEG
jgi:hypothetical protein